MVTLSSMIAQKGGKIPYCPSTKMSIKHCYIVVSGLQLENKQRQAELKLKRLLTKD